MIEVNLGEAKGNDTEGCLGDLFSGEEEDAGEHESDAEEAGEVEGMVGQVHEGEMVENGGAE